MTAERWAPPRTQVLYGAVYKYQDSLRRIHVALPLLHPPTTPDFAHLPVSGFSTKYGAQHLTHVSRESVLVVQLSPEESGPFFPSSPNVRAGRQNVPTGIQYKVKNCSAGPPARAGRQNFFTLFLKKLRSGFLTAK